MEHLYLFRLDLRKLAFTKEDRHEFSITVAIPSNNEASAVKVAKNTIHSQQWWDAFIIKDVTMTGELWVAAYDGKPHVNTHPTLGTIVIAKEK